MYKKNQYTFLVICVFLALIVFFSISVTPLSELSLDTRENERSSCNAPLNNRKLDISNNNETSKGKKGLCDQIDQNKLKYEEEQGKLLNNFKLLIKPFVLVFKFSWIIMSYSYQIISICLLYPTFYVLQMFYNTFIHKPYTILRWIFLSFFPLYLFFVMAAVLGCFVGGASGWISEAMVTLLNPSSSLPSNNNSNSRRNNSNYHNSDGDMIIDENNENNANNNYNNNNGEENNSNANSYRKNRNNNYYYEESDDGDSEHSSSNENDNYDSITSCDDDNPAALAMSKIIQKEQKYETLKRRITALAELKAKNGGKLPYGFIEKYRKVTGKTF